MTYFVFIIFLLFLNFQINILWKFLINNPTQKFNVLFLRKIKKKINLQKIIIKVMTYFHILNLIVL